MPRAVAGVECRVFREPCPTPVSAGCRNTEERCALEPSADASVDGVACQAPRLLQPCDWQTRPDQVGQTVQVLPIGAIDGRGYPFVCAAGILGSSLPISQGGPQCAGPCEAGTYRQDVAEVECGACPDGAYCPEGAATPLPCPDGKHGNGTGLQSAADCAACPPGSWCNSGQAFRCGVGLVAVGEASNRTNLGACVRCPDERATTRGTGTASMAECVCGATYLTDPLADGVRCADCPLNLQCFEPGTTLPDLVVDAGHWRPGFGTTVARPCPHRAVCANGTSPSAVYDRSSDATCVAGRGVGGAYCLLCMEPATHYFDAAAERCLPCAETAGGAVALLVALALALAGVTLVRGRLSTQLGSTWRWWRAHATRVSFRAKLRVVISFTQIVTQLESVYVLQYPHAFGAFVGGLGFVNVDLHEWVPSLRLSCLVGARSLSSQLLVAAFVPLGVALGAPLAAVLRGAPLASSLPFVLGWTFLLFPSISSFGFRTLAPCECFELVHGGEECFLREDYEVQCTGTFFGRAVPPADVLAAAWVAIAVWAVGVPLLYAALLRASLRRRELQLALGMLLGDYRPEASGWELVAVAEKLVLTGFLALVEPGSWMQLFLGTVVALFAFVLQSRVQPYRTPSDNFLAFLSSLALVPIFLGSLGLQTKALGLSIDSVFLVAVLFAFSLLVLGAALLFFVAELHGAAEILLVQATRQPPVLALAEGKRWHLFLSHNWANQDAVATIKRQLQLLLPGVRVFLDVDDLESVDALEEYMRGSQAILILLGSTEYFASRNCVRELAAAAALGLPPMGVHDADVSKNGAPLAALRSACPAEHRAFVFGGSAPIAWHRVRDFQLMALAQIAERLLLAAPKQPGVADAVDSLPTCIHGGVAWAALRFARPVALYESANNPSVAAAGRELRERFGDGVELAGSVDEGAAWLLMLSADAFEGEEGARLAAEVEGALRAGVQPTMLYEPEANAFGAIIDATPPRLKELGLYGPLAIEWRGGAFRAVSVGLVARALGARAAHGCGVAWAREWAGACAGAAASVCGGAEARARVRERALIEGADGVRTIEMQISVKG